MNKQIHAAAGENLNVGISMCLLGEKVRFDGGHKKDRYLTDVLGGYFRWVPVCPELEVGMGVPREPVRLVGAATDPRMIGQQSGTDWTKRMQSFAQSKIRSLARENLAGFILKSDSPSCGMERVRVYSKKNIPAKSGRGLFAAVLLENFPLMPVEEEGRLNDSGLRENFITRVFAYHRLMLMFEHFSRKALVEFHTVHKYLMLAHSPDKYRLLGRIVADQKSHSPGELKQMYSAQFMEGLRVRSTVKRNVNVLQHIMGYFRGRLSEFERREIADLIEDYRREVVPLIVPLALVKHYVRKYDIEFIRDQVYLNPHPKELMLRNHV
jgi:uncharacterized protein YbgA (DUF1722 family)/uncharacterized protein YbbK (DUF523 family)